MYAMSTANRAIATVTTAKRATATVARMIDLHTAYRMKNSPSCLLSCLFALATYTRAGGGT